MKVVILAGGLDTRISEETHLKSKSMIEIGGALFWHIMKIYPSLEEEALSKLGKIKNQLKRLVKLF